MQRQNVESETFLSIGYDPRRHVMEAEFTGGDIYRYYNFEGKMWESLMNAPSKGEFFAHHIRDLYDFKKMT